MTRHETSPWLLRFGEPTRVAVDLICAPYAGAGGSVFAPWAAELERDVALWALEYPGRGTRLFEPPMNLLGSVVERAATALVPQLSRPFVLFGHSLGALVAFELSRYLSSRHGLDPACLVVSGYAAPQIPNRRGLHTLPDPELLESLRALHGASRAVLDDPRLARLLLPALRADFEICETYAYVPGPPLRCPIVALGGVDDLEVRSETLAAWRSLTTGTFRLHLFPGDHFFLHTAQSPVLTILSAHLHALRR